MCIVCSTDFSESAWRATLAAAQLAGRLGMALHLLHSTEIGLGARQEATRRARDSWARSRLAQQRRQLRTLAADVHVHVVDGPSERSVLGLAEHVAADLVVVSATDRFSGREEGLCGHAERVAQSAPAPVLVVREPAPFERWVLGTRPLRIVLAVESWPSARRAVSLVAALARAGRCDVTVLHVYELPSEPWGDDLSVLPDRASDPPPAPEVIERAVRGRLERGLVSHGWRLRLEPHVGAAADKVCAVASEMRTDMLVVGSRAEKDAGSPFDGSVAREILLKAPMSALYAPLHDPERSQLAR